MTLSRLWVVLAVLLPVLASLIARISTVDLAYQLRAGAEILATGRIPTVDTWTFTVQGQPWLDQQWGAQVVLRLVESVGGWVGLAVFRAVLVGVIFGGTALIAVRRGLDIRTAAVLSLIAFVVAAPALALRPQLLGMVCFVAVLLLVVDRRDHPQRLWLAPVIVAIWANLHGSFFLGPLVLGLAWLEDLHDRAPVGAADARRDGRQRSRRVSHTARAVRVGVCRRPDDERRGHHADHGVAADLAPGRARAALLRIGPGDRDADRPVRSARRLADPCLARRLLPDRGVRPARGGLVADRGRDRHLPARWSDPASPGYAPRPSRCAG